KGLIHIVVIVLTYVILSIFYFKISRKTNFIATVLAIFALSILPYKAVYKTDRLANFSPKNDSISLYNTLRTFSGYFFLYLRMPQAPIPDYPEYTYDYKNVADRNVILILGESTNANRIGLLGYERNTNPLLSEWAKNDKNFVAKRAISSAVLTRVAVPSLLNIAYKPDNIKHILNEKTHLVYLAKKAGFKTFYYSAQTISELSDISSENLDEFFTRENYYFEHKQLGDLLVLEKLKENQDKFLHGKNFVILHQRNAHSPYQRGYRAYQKADVFKPMTRENTYDNAMIFNDYFISSVFEVFKELSQKSGIPTYVIFIPDHAEAMGELGRDGHAEYGHSFLSANVANIPIFATTFNVKNDDFIIYLKQSKLPTHYELAKLLAKEIGYDIHNSLEEPNVFYINGVDISGNAGYIKVLRDGDKAKFEYFDKE
ncbi:sulfatase-like hydrolase/transferase, partial [Campylobacter jejuni]